TKVRLGTLKRWSSELNVTSLKVNEPIPPETFELHWPRFVAVAHEPAVNGRFKVEIWDDDRPVAEVKKVQDLKTIEADLRKDPVIAAELGPSIDVRPPAAMSSLVKLSIVLGALAAVMVALALYRRIREQAAA